MPLAKEGARAEPVTSDVRVVPRRLREEDELVGWWLRRSRPPGTACFARSDGNVPVLRGMRYCLLKRPENLTESQEVKLADLSSSPTC